MNDAQGGDAPTAMPIPKVAGIIRGERCEKCKWSMAFYGGDPGQLECHRYPPQVSVTVVGSQRQRTPNGQVVDVPMVQTAGNFPLTQPHGFCGEWRAKVEGLS